MKYKKVRSVGFFYKVICLGALLLSLPGCIFRHTRKSTVHVPVSQEQRIRYIDVPLAIDAFDMKMYEKEGTRADSESDIFSYYSHAGCDQLVRFYQHEMVYRGWYLYGEFGCLKDTILIYEKPTKRCVVHIVQGKAEHYATVCLYIRPVINPV